MHLTQLEVTNYSMSISIVLKFYFLYTIVMNAPQFSKDHTLYPFIAV